MAKIIRVSSGKQTVTANIALTFTSDFPMCVPWKNKACEMLKGRSGKGEKGPGVKYCICWCAKFTLYEIYLHFINFVQNSTFHHAFWKAISLREKTYTCKYRTLYSGILVGNHKSRYVAMPHKPLRGYENHIAKINILVLVNAGTW